MADSLRTLVVVDDEPSILKALTRALQPVGCRIQTFDCALGALAFLEAEDAGVIISDQVMAAMQGTEFLRRAARRRPNASRILLTGHPDEQEINALVNTAQAWRYITKPWSNEALRALVVTGFERYERLKGGDGY